MGMKYTSPQIRTCELEEQDLLMVSDWNDASIPDNDNNMYNY